MRRWAAVLAVVLATTAVAVGLARRDEDGAGRRGGPGTVLPGGIEVADGSRLVGVPFPAGVDDRGFAVVLELDGDQSATAAAYVAQAAALGVALVDADTRGLCHEDAVEGPTCSAYAYDERGASLSLFVTGTHVLLSYDPTLFDAHGLDAMPVGDREPADVPRTGELFGEGLIYDDFALRVEPGSELVTPLTWNGGLTGGFTTVARVTGDPDDVFERYAATAEEEAGDPYGRRRFTWRGMRAQLVRFDEAGGLKIDLTMVETDGDGAWLYVNVGND